MLLRNSLYHIVASSEVGYTIRFDASHPVFAGHFPGHPIVPGACLVQIAEELLSEQVGHTERFTAIRNLKFRQPVTPDMQVVMSVREDGKIEVRDLSLTEVYAQFAANMCPDTDVQ